MIVDSDRKALEDFEVQLWQSGRYVKRVKPLCLDPEELRNAADVEQLLSKSMRYFGKPGLFINVASATSLENLPQQPFHKRSIEEQWTTFAVRSFFPSVLLQFMTLRMVEEHQPFYVVNYFDASLVPSDSSFGDRYFGRKGVKMEEATATVP